VKWVPRSDARRRISSARELAYFRAEDAKRDAEHKAELARRDAEHKAELARRDAEHKAKIALLDAELAKLKGVELSTTSPSLASKCAEVADLFVLAGLESVNSQSQPISATSTATPASAKIGAPATVETKEPSLSPAVAKPSYLYTFGIIEECLEIGGLDQWLVVPRQLICKKEHVSSHVTAFVALVREAVEQLHAAGYAHQDVRWPNVCFFFDADGRFHAAFLDLDRMEEATAEYPGTSDCKAFFYVKPENRSVGRMPSRT